MSASICYRKSSSLSDSSGSWSKYCKRYSGSDGKLVRLDIVSELAVSNEEAANDRRIIVSKCDIARSVGARVVH